MKTKEIVLVAASTFLLIVGAYISVQIGPVPVVLTNFFIILVGLLFGWKVALISVVTYIIMGALGLPVFSGGKGGFAHLTGLTGGFILSYIPLGLLSGFVMNRKVVTKVVVVIAASILVYLIGVPWAMWVYNNVIITGTEKLPWDMSLTLKYTTIPFLIPDLIKIVVAVVISVVLDKTLKPFRNNE